MLVSTINFGRKEDGHHADVDAGTSTRGHPAGELAPGYLCAEILQIKLPAVCCVCEPTHAHIRRCGFDFCDGPSVSKVLLPDDAQLDVGQAVTQPTGGEATAGQRPTHHRGGR